MPYKKLKFLKFWYGLGLVWVLVVIYLSTTSHPPDTSGIVFGDKIFHSLGYFCLFYWFAQIYRKHFFWRPAFALIGMGILLELVQYQLGYRTLEVADMLANTAGVLLGWVVGWFVCDGIFQTLENQKLFK